MKKLGMAMVLVFLFVVVASATASAKCNCPHWRHCACEKITDGTTAYPCNYYHWRWTRPCKSDKRTDGVASRKCEYFQWRWTKCRAEHVAAAPAEAPKAKPAPLPKTMVLEGVRFDTASAVIKPASYRTLDSNVEKLQDNPNKNVTVVGYTDDRGNDKYNQRLSQMRAKAVADYFISKGIDKSRLSSEGRGEANPIADNTTAEGRAINRRIELETK